MCIAPTRLCLVGAILVDTYQPTFGCMKSFTTILISHVVFLAAFGVAAIALAQTEATSSDRVPTREAIEERQAERAERASTTREDVQERREDIEEKQEERRAALTERAQERITNLAANMSNRIDAAIARLTKIHDRIESRSEKLALEGVDTTAAQVALGDAQTALGEAAAIIGNIDSLVAEAVGSENPRAGWGVVKSTFQAAAVEIRTAHQHLRAAVAALKEAVAQRGEGVSRATQSDTASDNSEREDSEETEDSDEAESDTTTSTNQ